MSCKPTYKGKRYNSLEELKSSVVTPQQKQQAQQLYSQYLEQNPNGSIQGFKDFVQEKALATEQSEETAELVKPDNIPQEEWDAMGDKERKKIIDCTRKKD